MPPKRRHFVRPLGKRRYHKLFVIAVEGIKTEPQYFALFNYQSSLVLRVNCLKGNHKCSPLQVLNRMSNYLKIESLKETDEAWLVVDKDNWTDEQLAKLHEWSKRAENYGFALSNPKFEYWLLLHFEDGIGIANAEDCSSRLKRHLPLYDKSIDAQKFSMERIHDAIKRAKNRDNPQCIDWPRHIGGTTVYRLVENIIQSRHS